jgi:hypothetical protein
MIHLDCSRRQGAYGRRDAGARDRPHRRHRSLARDQCIEMPTIEDETVARRLSLDIAHHLPSWSQAESASATLGDAA